MSKTNKIGRTEQLMATTGPQIFLDTSIQIARHVHSPAIKDAIKRRLSQHSRHVSSLVVRQEFKRRLLKEADYLLRMLHRYGSFEEVNHHVIRLFNQWQGRKRSICLQALTQVHGGTDAERTARLRLYLRSLLVTGLRRFDQMLDEVRSDSHCSCARIEIVEKEKFRRYDLGKDKCSQTKPGNCGIRQFLTERAMWARRILTHLRSLPQEKKSRELQNAEAFLSSLADGLEQVQKLEPCLKLGDLLIALESAEISHFLTLNSIESQHLCRAMQQTLIIQPADPSKSEVVCAAVSPAWPEFGSGSVPKKK